MKEEIIMQLNSVLASLNMVFVCGYENCGNMTSSMDRIAKIRDFLRKNCEIVAIEKSADE